MPPAAVVKDCVWRVCCEGRLGCSMASPGGSVPGEREGWFGPDGLGVGVPAVVSVAAVRDLASGAESSTDVGPGSAPVERPCDGGIESLLGGLLRGDRVGGGSESVGAESFGSVHRLSPYGDAMMPVSRC